MTLAEIKKAIKLLKPDERAAFIAWCISYQEAEELKELSRNSNAIAHSEVLSSFRKIFDAVHNPEFPSCHDGCGALLDFYRNTRIQKCPFSADADMLLIQWGPDLKRRCYTLTFTRQLIPQTSRDADIWQLHLEYSYSLNAVTKKLGSGNQWCHSIARPEYSKFQEFMRGWSAADELSFHKPKKIDLRYEKV